MFILPSICSPPSLVPWPLQRKITGSIRCPSWLGSRGCAVSLFPWDSPAYLPDSWPVTQHPDVLDITSRTHTLLRQLHKPALQGHVQLYGRSKDSRDLRKHPSERLSLKRPALAQLVEEAFPLGWGCVRLLRIPQMTHNRRHSLWPWGAHWVTRPSHCQGGST